MRDARTNPGRSEAGWRPGRIAILLGLLCLWTPGARAADEVVFKASVNRTKVPLDGQVRLTISVALPNRKRMQSMDLPDTGSLRVVSTSREQSMSFSFKSGTSQYQNFTNTILTLQPSKEGKVRIGSAVLRYAGKTYKTKPITIRVTAARGGQRGGPVSPVPGLPRGFPDDDWFRDPFDDMVRRPAPIGDRDIFVRAYATPDLVVEGQQITVTVLVYSRVGARIAGVRWPKLTPFYSVERDVSKATTEEKYIDGVRYQYKVLARRALFPLQAGEFTIDPVEVEVEASTSPFFPADARKLHTRPLKIKVEPLPDGAPEGFHRSNVGSFTLSSRVDANDVKLNQPITYTMTVRGTGNVQNLRPPELPHLDRFKVFDPTVDVQQAKRGSKVKGSKTFEYILLPLASGELTIPALTFSFFDPSRGEYRTLKTREEVIQVKAGGAQAGGDGGSAGREVNIVAGAFKPIRFESSLRGYGPPFYRNALFVPLLVMPPLVYLLFVFGLMIRSRVLADSPRSRMRRASAEARRQLKNAERQRAAGRAEDFYAAVKESLLYAIEARTGRPAAGLQLSQVQQLLAAAQVPQAVVDRLVREIENCDFGRFAPASARGGEMASAQERVGRLLKELQREREDERQPDRRQR